VLGMPRRGKRRLGLWLRLRVKCAAAGNEVTEVRVLDGNGRQERLTEMSIPAGGSRRDEIGPIIADFFG
jgi:hypothetical protein